MAVAAVVVGLDQWAGTWAVHRLSRGPVHVLGPIDLELGVNTGAAFSLGRGWAPVFAVLAAVVVVVLVLASRRAWSDGLAVAVGLVVGGAAGNLVDRLARPYHGGVVDYIDLHWWPTFNVADACITVGVVLIAVSLWRSPRNVGDDRAAGGAGQQPETGGGADPAGGAAAGHEPPPGDGARAAGGSRFGVGTGPDDPGGPAGG